jgi:hypothetical protein
MRRAILFVLVFGGLVRAEPFQGNHKTDTPQHAPHISQQTNTPPAAPTVAAPLSKQTASDKQENPQNKHYDWHEIVSPSSWSNWALVLVGIAGTLLALRSLGIIRQQTQHTKTAAEAAKASADAAFLSAQGIINAERAWITGSIGRESYRLYGNPSIVPEFQLTLTNSGRTPGVVSRVMMRFIKLPTLADLPPKPPLDIRHIADLGNTLIVREERPLSITTPIEEEKALNPEEVNAVKDGKLFLLVFGFIEYTNVIKPDFANPHKAGFCFVYAVASPTSYGFQTCFTAPASYREMT